MSDNKSLHQRMKKISKFITKVKEKAHNVFHEEEGVEKATTMTRRHSSYIRPPTEEQSNINLFDTRLKQEGILTYNSSIGFHGDILIPIT